MSKFIGIDYDKWHAILAAIVVAIIFPIIWFTIGPQIKRLIGPAAAFVLIWAFAVLVAHHLQCWYETRQMRDPAMKEKYGSCENFVDNSKTDFRYFWQGIAVSWILPGIMLLIF